VGAAFGAAARGADGTKALAPKSSAAATSAFDGMVDVHAFRSLSSGASRFESFGWSRC
jgi:hypothetical protein